MFLYLEERFYHDYKYIILYGNLFYNGHYQFKSSLNIQTNERFQCPVEVLPALGVSRHPKHQFVLTILPTSILKVQHHSF